MTARPKFESVINRIAMLVIVIGIGFAALVLVASWTGDWLAG